MEPVVELTSRSTVSVRWTPLQGMPQELSEFYQYQIQIQAVGGSINTTTIDHPAQNTTIKDLLPNTQYKVRITPYRQMSGKQYHEDIREYGEPSLTVAFTTNKGQNV